MGPPVWCPSVGQGEMLQTHGDLSGRRAFIIMFLVVMLIAEITEAISDFGINSLTIQSNEDLHRSIAKTEGTKRRKARFTVRLHLPGVLMSRHLSDRSSPQYRTLSRALSRDIQRLFVNTPGKQRISNIRFRKFREHHKEHGSLNEAGSPQTEIYLPTSHPSPNSLSRTSSTPQSPPSISTNRPKQRGNSATSFSRSTAAVSTSSWRPERLQLSKTTTTGKLFSAQETLMTVTPSVRTTTTGKLFSAQETVMTVTPSVRTTTTGKLFSAQETLMTVTPSVRTTTKGTSPQTITTLKQIPTTTDKAFDIAHITRLFKECYTRSPSGDYNILLDKYLDAYTELMGFFKFFGPVFSFAGDDIKDNLIKLRQLRKHDTERSQNNYITFQSMFQYEHSPQGSHAEQEGTSTNRWIHRALKFISELIKASLNSASSKSLGDHAQELYTAILAPQHPWYVRTVAYLALLSFPTRSSLMEQMGIRDNAEDLQELADLASAIDAVYEDVENLYVKYLS